MNKMLVVDVDAAMVEMQNIHPPLRRSECARLINAAIAAIQAQGVPNGLTLAAIGHKHFGNPIPQAWYAAAKELLASAPPASQAEQHPDDAAVDRFTAAMKAKLASARAKGRGGWQECDAGVLSGMLREHVEKGDPRDVANFCMFLWSLGHGIAPQAKPQALSDEQLKPLLAAEYNRGWDDCEATHDGP